jgi:hypothetical protein
MSIGSDKPHCQSSHRLSNISKKAPCIVLSARAPLLFSVGDFYRRPKIAIIQSMTGSIKSPNGQVYPWTYTKRVEGNRWRNLASGRCIECCPNWLYCDDTSGNTSKRWNKHNSFLFTLAVHLICTSNISPPIEMLKGVATQVRCCYEFFVWNSKARW